MSTPPPATCSRSSSQKLDQQGVRLVFAEMKDPARRKIDRYGLEHVLAGDRYYPTITTATTRVRRGDGCRVAIADLSVLILQ